MNFRLASPSVRPFHVGVIAFRPNSGGSSPYLQKKTDKRNLSATALLHDLKAFEHGAEPSAVIENRVDSLQNMATEAAVGDHDGKGPK